jgi:hypothetical protein
MNHFYFYDSIVHRNTDEIDMASWFGVLMRWEGKAHFSVPPIAAITV